MAYITYPKAYQDFLNVLNVLNIGSWVRSAGCVTYVDFHLRFLVMTIGPILTVPILAGTYLYVVQRHGASGETLDYAWQKHVSSLLFIMFYVYNGSSSVIFEMFECGPRRRWCQENRASRPPVVGHGLTFEYDCSN